MYSMDNSPDGCHTMQMARHADENSDKNNAGD